MNKRNLICLFVFAFFFATGKSAWAQQDSPPPKLILAPVGDMKWRITIQPKGVTTPGSFDPSLLEYSHSGEWTRLVVTYGQSQTTEWWIAHGYTLNRYSSTIITIVREDFASPHPFPPYPYAPADFYGMDQINPNNDHGDVIFQGIKCRYYSDKTPVPPSDPTKQRDSGGYEAWFDVKTGLPKGFWKAGKFYLYEFLPAVPSEVQVPADFQARLNLYFAMLRRAGLTP
jgi:hypothetical protein